MKSARYSFLAFALSFALLLGCGVPGIPRPPSLDLPRPVTDLRAVRKGNLVYLAWTAPIETTDNLPVRGVTSPVVCRSPGAMRPGCAGGVLPAMLDLQKSAPRKSQPGPASRQNFVDILPSTLLGYDPTAQIFYAVSVFNRNNRTAGISNVVSVPAVVALPPPADFHAEVTAEGVILTWPGIPGVTGIPDTPELSHRYRIYRRDEKTNQDAVAGEVPLYAFPPRLADHSFEWEKTYFYRATIVTLLHPSGQPETQFEGADTPPVKVFAHDIFPPAVPSDLQAVFSGVGQQPFIDLIWAPDTEADLAGYNVYRREEGSEPVKINSAPIKSPSFRDTNDLSGHTYFYSVSAIDVRGNESARSPEASERVP